MLAAGQENLVLLCYLASTQVDKVFDNILLLVDILPMINTEPSPVSGNRELLAIETVARSQTR